MSLGPQFKVHIIFASTSPLKNNAAARLSLVAIDFYSVILASKGEAVTCCGGEEKYWETYWDHAVALTLGWKVGM